MTKKRNKNKKNGRVGGLVCTTIVYTGKQQNENRGSRNKDNESWLMASPCSLKWKCSTCLYRVLKTIRLQKIV